MSFTNGQRVEVVQIEQGLEDSLFAAKILPLPKKRKRGTKIFYVEYDNFFDDKGTKKLREYVDFTRLRPLPPQDLHSTRAFQVSEEVDVSWNDAWWKGVITKAHNGGLTYSVFFEHTLEEFEYDRADLRTHHDWLDGNWVRSKIQITSSDCLETALPKEEEETRGFPNQTGESARASDMSTPQSSSGAIDIVVENTMPSSSNVCEMIDNSSDTKRIHSSYGSVVSEQHIFKKVRDRLTKKVPIVLHACDSRKRSSKALDVFAFPTRDCQRNFTEGEQDASLCRSRGQSHEEHHTVLPMGQTKEDVCSSGIKLVGVGRFENQTEVLETEHLKDFGEKTKRTKGEARTVCTSQDTAAWWKLFWHFEGDENECSANEIPDSQRESTPLPIQAAEDSYLILQSTPIPGLDPESAARENEVVDKVCEEHQHLSVVPESLVLPDSGGIPLDNQLMSTERDGSTERLVSSEKSNPVEGPSFIKKVWEIIESIQVLKSIPQHPHFGPLKHENDLHREGYIIGHMLNFANLAEKLKRAKLEQPRSKFEDISNAVSDFEKLGFTVHPFQTHLEELLALKDSYSQLEESSKSAKDEFIAAKSKSDELQESINSVKMKLKRDMTEMEMKASKLAERQGTLDEIKQQLQIAKLDFDTAVQAPF